jgi:D-alanine-D-alanine ligase
MKVLLLKGGPDAEHEVSLNSGRQVSAALRRAGMDVHDEIVGRLDQASLAALPGDVIFPVLHGPWGEGGPLQELLVADGRPFVGCLPAAARLAMDKPASKAAVASAGVPTPACQVLGPGDTLALGAPLILKPCDEGSSVDLRVCRTQDEAEVAMHELLTRRPRLMAEAFIEGAEVTAGILDGEVLPLIEIRPHGGLYDYEAKYLRDDTQYLLDPPLAPGVSNTIREHALRVWRCLGLRDLARVDFMVDARGPWFLEANTMPGMTDHSLVPKAAAHAGVPMETLVRRLVEQAAARALKFDAAPAPRR